jgi:DNA-binding beta-propeller fold protein YncE
MTAHADSPPEFVLMWGQGGQEPGQFNIPVSMAIAPTGELYIPDHHFHRVQVFTDAGDYLFGWGTEGVGPDQLFLPYGIAFASDGNVFIVEQGNRRVHEFTSLGAHVAMWGSPGVGPGEFDTPQGLAIDEDDYLYVADRLNHRIQKFARDGTFLLAWGEYGTEDGQFKEPYDVKLGPDGLVYVCDTENRHIQVFTTGGDFIRKWGSFGEGQDQFIWPLGIDVDDGGNVYVTDGHRHWVKKFTNTGTYLTQWGTEGTGPGEFHSPFGVCADGSSVIYVIDSYNNRIQKFAYFHPLGLSIVDVPNDQGREVRVTFPRSGADVPGSPTPILQYEAFRRIDDSPGANPALDSGDRDQNLPRPGLLRSMRTPGWEFVGAIPAHGETEYNMIVPTLVDSTASEGIQWSAFFVRAATEDPLTYFDSPPDSGYSVDNLAPSVPTGFTYTLPGLLSWDEAPEEDFDYFIVYGSESGTLDGSATRIAYTTRIEMDVRSHLYAFYHLTATDFSGNEGGAATLENTELEGATARLRPDDYGLHTAQPNPFTERTTIAFDVPLAEHATLQVYDVSGRLVRTLVDGTVEPGRYRPIWDGRDAAGRLTSPGVYLISLKSGDFSAARKLVRLR